MRVCVLIDAWFPHVGGGQIHAWELAKCLVDAHQLDIDLITREHPGTVADDFLRYKGKHGTVKVVKFGPPLPFENIFGRLFYLIQVLIYLIPKKYDLIHVHAFSPAMPAKLISFLKGTPVIMTVHGTSVEGYKNMKLSWRERLFLEIEKILLFKIKYNAEISVSADFKNIPNVNRNIQIITTGANISQFNQKSINKDKQFKILFVGRLHKQKGLNYLIQAMRLVLKSHNNVKLVIVGQGSEKDNLAELAHNTLGDRWRDNVQFKTLSQNELVREYLSARLFVLPSVYEGSPIVLFEAWGAKLPVIGTRVGAIPDLIKDGINGYIIDPKNPEQLAEKIIYAIHNKNLEKMGEEGLKTAKEYSWEKMADKVYKVFQKVLNEKS